MASGMCVSNAALRTPVHQSNQQHQIQTDQHHRGGQIDPGSQATVLAVFGVMP